MKNLKKSDIISSLLCLSAMIPGIAVYGKLPERIITNWDFSNGATGTHSKAFVVFAFPIIFAVITLIGCYYSRKLEKKDRAGILPTLMGIFFPAGTFVTQGMILLTALGMLSDIRLVICLIVSVSMIILGNYTPKLRKNWFFGIRTPHTLTNDEIWHRTQRFAGFIMTICGIAALITTLCGLFAVSLVILLSSVIIPTIYGEAIYYIGRKNKQEQQK